MRARFLKIAKQTLCFLLLAAMLMPAASIAAPNGDSPDIMENLEATGLNQALGGEADLKAVIGNIIKVLLGLIGIILVILILWAGFLWMTAMGDDGKIKTAKAIIVRSIIGVLIILTAYAITAFTVNSFQTAITGN